MELSIDGIIGEGNVKAVLPVGKNRYKAYDTEEWVSLAKEIAPSFDYPKMTDISQIRKNLKN